jgi:phosphatidate cytidylyltransferase
VVMGVLLALVGTAGDLMESLIKRDIGVKDISSWLPGHGGFLDRLDSILPSAAVAYAIFLIAH